MKPRTKPSDVRRDELMDAAAMLFIEKGVEATIVDHIVAAAGVSKGTFYHYFASKAEIVNALGARFTTTFLDNVDNVVSACPPNDWAGRVRSWIMTAARTYLDNFRLHDVVFHEYGHSHRDVGELTAVYDRLAALIAGGAAAGVWSIKDPRLAAIMIFHSMHGAVDDMIAHGLDGDDAPIDLMCQMALQMLGSRTR